jgi:glycosyltransferase involved in cell wall biosynthesis
MSLTRRLDDAWTLKAEMRALAWLSDSARRRTNSVEIDGWVHLVGGYGRLVKERYVTVFDMSPTQLLAAAPGWCGSFGYPDATRRLMARVAKRHAEVYRHAFACCVPSRWAADSLVRDHGIAARHVRVVGYGRNVDIRPPRERDWSVPRFLFVGWDWQRKNGDAVIRAFARLRGENGRARLDLVGGHPTISVDGVVGHGPISVYEPDGRRQLETLFGAATCFVMPSLLEPFGIVYVEAAAAGLASIATAIGGTAESVGDGGIRVDPHDDDAIYRAMRDLSDPDTARHLGGRAQTHAASLTWPAFGMRVLASLELAPAGLTPAEFL